MNNQASSRAARDLETMLEGILSGALALARDLDLYPHLTLALVHNRDLDLTRARDITRDITRALTPTRDITRSLAPALTRNIDLTRDIAAALAAARDRAADLYLDSARDLARDLDRVLGRADGLARDLDAASVIALDYFNAARAGRRGSAKDDRSAAVRVSRQAKQLAKGAARLLPAADRTRYAEEWAAELWGIAEADGKRRPQVAHAMHLVRGALVLRFELARPQWRKAP
jgi:hypothetical protein